MAVSARDPKPIAQRDEGDAPSLSAPQPHVGVGFLLRPKWIAFDLLIVGLIVAMINLGFWQLRRLQQRRDFNTTIEQRYDAPARPLDEVLGARATEPPSAAAMSDVDWYPVTASGVYLQNSDIAIVNRSQGGTAGDNAVTPLQLDDGRVLLVNRGLVPAARVAPEPPTGRVSIVGRLRTTQQRTWAGLSDTATGTLSTAQRIDIDRLAAQLPGPVVPMYVDIISSTPPSQIDGVPIPVAAPELSEGNHLSYAFQWFIFAIAAAIGWVLAVRKSIANRRQAARQIERGAESSPDTESADTESAATESAATEPVSIESG